MQLPFEPSKYQIWRHIGSSLNSDIFLARCLTNNQLVSIKQYDLEKSNISFAKIRNEISTWLNICHPNTVKYYQSFTFGSKIWILSECANDGSLHDIIELYHPNGIQNEILISSILRKILLFLNYFHSANLIHKNLKTSKILLLTDGEIKVSGFNFSSSLIQNGLKKSERKAISSYNTYLAPEVMDILSLKGYTQSADIWSVGIIAFEIATGKTPFYDCENFEQLKKKIDSNLPKLPDHFSSSFRDFVSKCLTVKKYKRPTAKELLNHSFIQKAEDEKYIEKYLTSNFPPLIKRFNFCDINIIDEKEKSSKKKKYEFVFTDSINENIKEIEHTTSIDDFILQNKIGKGSFGKVYKVKSKKDGKIYAAKISNKSYVSNSAQEIRDISREVNIIAKINHPSILKFILFSSVDFKSRLRPVIFTEFASNGSLENLIQKEKYSSNGILKNINKLIIIYGVASAMSYLHSHKILHRDLKPDNILIDEFLFPKIADFGLSKVNHFNQVSMTMKSTIGSIKGTPIYMAPEI